MAAVRLPVLAFIVLLLSLSFFRSASCQESDDDAYPSASPPAYPPTTTMGPPSPLSPSAFTYPPSPSQPLAYPPISVSPGQGQPADASPGPTTPDLSQPPIYFSYPSEPPIYPPSLSPSPSPSPSDDASDGPVMLSPSAFVYPPGPSQPPTYSPSVSPSPFADASDSPSALSPSTFAYPPGPSQPPASLPSPPSPIVADQSPPTYPPSPSLPTYPPSASPSSSPDTTNYPSSPSPSTTIDLSPSPSQDSSTPAAYPPSTSPSNPTYLPSPSPSSATTYPPSPTTSSPTYPPSPSPTPVVYPPTPTTLSPTYPPSPSPTPPTHSPILSPGPSPTYPPNPSPASVVYPPSPTPPTHTPIPSLGPSPPSLGLIVGHYNYSCPNAEAIIRKAVQDAVYANRGTGAGLIRLFFHDCFVRGCDASVLLNTTGSDDATELQGAPNLTLRGFEVINAAKAALEDACPGVVSCADIVAFAGRDATYFLSGWTTDFDMPAGRYDGRVSLASETIPNLPAPFFGLQKLTESFAAKGLDLEDMVTLSGAHSVGRSLCSSFSGRLSPNAGGSDMDPALAASLRKQCSSGGDEPTVVEDLVTPDDLDTQYYKNVISHEVLFDSDAALMASNRTASMVLANVHVAGLWERRFKAAMVKMGGVGVKTAADGEIRKKCWMIN